MTMWRDYINHSGPEPGEVDNVSLSRKIKRNRIKYNNPESDTDIGLADKVDFYIISVGFFKFFYDAFGCSSILVLKFTTKTEEVEINHDPLSSSQNQFRKLKNQQRDPNQAKFLKGREFTAIYESMEEVD